MTMNKITEDELTAINHKDLIQFAVDNGIIIPEDIKTKKALVPFLLEQVNESSNDNEETAATTEESKQKDSVEQSDEVSDDPADIEKKPPEIKESSSDEAEELNQPEDATTDYIDTPTANGVIRYNRATMSSQLIPYD